MAEEFCSVSVTFENEMMSPDVLTKKYFNKRAERYADRERPVGERCKVGDIPSRWMSICAFWLFPGRQTEALAPVRAQFSGLGTICLSHIP
jgi:hypothetical protein